MIVNDRDMHPIARPTGTRLEPGRIPLLEEQIAVLNAALTAECLRHAETQQKLLIALAVGPLDLQIEAAKEGL